MKRPKTQYTYVGDAQVAYQVLGEGPDLVYMQGVGSNADMWWDSPTWTRNLMRLASYNRLILFDRRGTGMSDPIRLEALGTWENYSDDLRAVLDAVESERTSIFAFIDAGPIAMVFAATEPERTRALILWTSYARSFVGEDYPIGLDAETHLNSVDGVAELWGTEELAKIVIPSAAEDAAEVEWVARSMRASCTPATAAAHMRYVAQIDARSVLSSIRVPTLVLHRRDYAMLATVAHGHYLADHIEGARFVEIQGTDANPWPEAEDQVQDIVEEFLTGARPAPRSDRVLATVLFNDIVRSTEYLAEVGDKRWRELFERYAAGARSLLKDFGGRLVKTTGDGILATFDLPGRAIRCARELAAGVAASAIEARTGLHVGEVELMPDGDVGGIAVHIAARVMSEAGPGEVLCTRTVKDLVAGSGIELEERGTHRLKGVPEEWQLFAVREN